MTAAPTTRTGAAMTDPASDTGDNAWATVVLTCDNEASPRGGGTPPRALTHLSDLSGRGLGVSLPSAEKQRPTCSITGCTHPAKARGWCKTHWARWKRHGDPHWEMTPLARLERQIDRQSTPGCWIWTGVILQEGYGQIRINGTKHLVHRWAYENFVRPIPAGMVIDHLCRNRACCNPDHLDIVEQGTNVARGMSPSAVVWRTGRCRRGHDLTDPSNVYVWAGRPTHRACRKCRQQRPRR